MGKSSKKKKISKTNKINHTGFFAFPGEPEDRKKIIEKAISIINSKEKQNNFKIISWTKIDKSSSRIISNILESIEKSDILIADISGLNPNVLFEVGFAFGLGKKILLFIQGFSDTERKKDISDIEIIGGLNIESYENSDQLSNKVLNNIPDIFTREPELYKYGYNPLVSKKYDDRGLFLKGITKHQIGLTALSTFKNIYNNCTVDDWNEDLSQNLIFYLKEIEKSSGIAALFVDHSWDASRKVNARFSFICGMALALKRNVLMIGLPGFKSPFDYKEILVTPKDDELTKKAINERFSISKEQPTINQLSPNLASFKNVGEENSDVIKNQEESKQNIIKNETKNLYNKGLSKEDKEIILLDVNIGNSIAENEELELADYFVKTGQYNQALLSKQAIIVGTKGSGKTACFYQIRDHFRENHLKNLICEIKPSDYRMERFLDSLKLLDEGKGLVGHVLESVWKYIVYSSILESLNKEIKLKPDYISISPEEDRLLKFVERYDYLISTPFEQKLEKACIWLDDVSFNIDNFSKKIHDEFLSEAKSILIPILNKKEKVIILLDNLDKAWEINSNLKLQAQLFFNLLGIHRRLHSDFGIGDVSVLIFIRRNIFEYILNNASREPDKLLAEAIELQWNDKDVLLRVLEERFKIASSYWERQVDNPWDVFFKWDNKTTCIKDWLFSSVLPRPRDLIRYIQKAIELAINHNHDEIHEDDLQKALVSYSGFALDQIIAEYKAEEPWIVDFLNSFVGEESYFKFTSLMKKIKNHSKDQLNYDQIINRMNTLVNINFFGVKFNGAPTLYAYNIQESMKLSSLIKNTSLHRKIQFIIHPVFYKHLNIKSDGLTNIWDKLYDIFKFK